MFRISSAQEISGNSKKVDIKTINAVGMTVFKFKRLETVHKSGLFASSRLVNRLPK